MAKVELIDFLVWIETHQHHKASTLDTSKGKGLLLEGCGSGKYQDRIRFYPTYYQDGDVRKIDNTFEPSRDPFDSRMFRATAAGRKLLREAGRWEEVKAKQAFRKPERKPRRPYDENDFSQAAWDADVAGHRAGRLETTVLQKKWGERGLYFR